MKKIILTIFCFGMLFPLLGSAARPYGVEEIPNVQVGNRYRFTSNPDGVLSPSAVAEIDSLCYSLRHRALAQVAVVAVEDIRGDDLFSFAHTLFSQWGVGRADSDNGLGILLVVDRREVRFVTGPGLEGVLPDALCKRIQMRYMLPYFREGDYSAGPPKASAVVRTLFCRKEVLIKISGIAVKIPDKFLYFCSLNYHG